MRTQSMRGAAIALALLGSVGLAFAQSSPIKPDPSQSGADPSMAKPNTPSSDAAPLAQPKAPVVNPESTVGLAPADQPINNANPSVAGQKLPSAQEDTAAHNASVFEHDKQPTLTHTFNFTKEQKQQISQALAGAKSASAKPGFEVKETSVLPESVELAPVPDSIGQQMPWVKPYKYVKLDNKILLVDPNYPVVVSVIE